MDHEGALVEHMRKLVVDAKMEGIKVGMLLNQADPVPRDEQACASCRFWLEQEVETKYPRRGDCRRCPPAPDPDSSFGAFPVTMHDCWCGEWKAK